MQWFAGTSGYSYKEWKGSFYPEAIKADAMLPFYAARLNAVEINNTFYRMPRSQVLAGWADAVPDGFRFVIKASRRITHQQRLKDAGESVDYLAGKLTALGDKLGAVLFQLPPYLRRDDALLGDFLDHWDGRAPAAMEFRHASWLVDDVLAALRDRDVALVVSEDGVTPPPAVTATAPIAYLRLRKPGYTDAELEHWVERITASGAATTFAFFKHEDAGAGPALAERLLTLTGAARRTARGPRAAGHAQRKGKGRQRA